MSPSSLTTSTTRRLLKSSAGTNPATRCPRTCLTRNSSALFTTVHSGQRTVDKLITLLKKVCCQFSPFLCVTQERGDPCMNLVRSVRAAQKDQVATQKKSESGFSLNDKKTKFSLIIEQRFRNTSSKPILIGEVSRNWVDYRVSVKRNSSCSCRRWTTSTWSTTSSWSITRTKSGSSRRSHEKS